MTISTEPTQLSYSGDDSTVAFPVTWNYFAKSHVVATLRDSSGTETTWVLDTDYTLTNADLGSGTLTATTPPATGETLVIDLDPPNTQEKSLPIGGSVPTPQIEDGLDLAAQRDAKLEALIQRTMRVPATDTQIGDNLILPIDSLRADKYLGFDSNGKPTAQAGTTTDGFATNITYTPAGSGASSTDVQTKLRSLDSYDSIYDAAVYAPQASRTAIHVINFYDGGSGGGGVFYWDSSQNKANANGITIIDPSTLGGWAGLSSNIGTTYFGVTGQGSGSGMGCWIRINDNVINAKWAGATGDGTTDDTVQLEQGFAVAKASGAEKYVIPGGTYLFDKTAAASPALGLYFSLPSTDGMIIEGDGVNVTVLKNGSATAAGVYLTGGNGFCIRDITIDNNGSTGSAFRQPGQYSRTERLEIKNQGGASTYAMVVDGSTNASISHVNFAGCTNCLDVGPTTATNYVTFTAISGEMTTGRGLRCNLGANLRFYGLYVEPEGSAGNSEKYVEFTNCSDVNIYGFAAEPSGSRTLTDDAYVDISNCRSINFYGGRVNHQSATASKTFFKISGTANRNITFDGLYLASDQTGMTLFDVNTSATAYGVQMSNIVTNLTSTAVGVAHTSALIQAKISNWVDNNAVSTFTLNAQALVCENLTGAIAVTSQQDQTFINCSGAFTGTGASTSVRINSHAGETGGFVQTLTGAGAVNLTQPITHIVTTAADALTLADGTENQHKYIVMKTDGGDGTLTPTNLGNGTTITFNDVGDSAQLLFTNGAWHFMGGTATLA